MIGRLSGRRAFAAFTDASLPIQRGRTRDLWCRYLDSPAPPLRVAYAIGKRYGNAVARNRLRRRLRVIVADVAGRRGLDTGALLIGAHPSAAGRSFDELVVDMTRLLGQVSPAERR